MSLSIKSFFLPLLLGVVLFGCNAQGVETISSQLKNEKSRDFYNLPLSAGRSCLDPSNICLGLRYVVFKDSKNRPVVSRYEAIRNVEHINSIWKGCQIEFQIEELIMVTPSDHELNFHTAEDSELFDIRHAFDDGQHILVATTGEWDRSGSLGDTEANAWTSMPGEGLYGAILESSVGTFYNIIAHELGHYLGLDHDSDESNLMSPIIYDDSEVLTEDQCSLARKTISSEWSRVVRNL